MTLDTRIYVLDKVDSHELFRFCSDLLGANKTHTYSDRMDRYPREQWMTKPGNAWTISNDPGQGLPAWLLLYYRPGMPLRTPEQAAEHDEDICNVPEREWYDAEAGPCDGVHPFSRACWLTVSFDTAYGYSDDRGYGCGDLHAEYVARVGRWLDERGVRWEWMNEFTSEIHSGYGELSALGSGGFKASEWFRTSVLPAIEAATAPGAGR